MSEMSWPAKNNWKLRWRSARRVARTLEVCGGAVIQLQPMDLNLGFERPEFAVAGYQFGMALFGQGRGKSVDVGNFVAGFVVGGLQNRGPVDIDTLKTDFAENGELVIGHLSRSPASQRIPYLSQIHAADPCVFEPCSFNQQIFNLVRGRLIVGVREDGPTIEDSASFQSSVPLSHDRVPARPRVLL